MNQLKQRDAFLHVQGKSQFTDDIPVPEGLLFGAVFSSPIAHGKIIRLNTENAKKISRVAGIFSAADIPGENRIGKIISDEPLFAEKEVHYIGQPIAIVISKSP